MDIAGNLLPVDFIRCTDKFRSGTFLFFKLPLEVRHRILQLALEPTFEWCRDTQRQHIRVFVSECEPGETPHPNRRANYDMKLGAPSRDYKFHNRWAFKEWTRQLSNVNTQFREEVSSIIWSNTTVVVRSADLSLTSDFLLDRPRTWKGIKSLQLGLSFHRGEFERLPQFCSSFSGKLLLDRLVLQIWVQEKELENIVQGVGDFATLTSLRQIIVKDKVTIIWSIRLIDEDSDISHGPSQIASEKRLVSKYEPRFLELVMPNSLRVQALAPATEMQQYLSTRSTKI